MKANVLPNRKSRIRKRARLQRFRGNPRNFLAAHFTFAYTVRRLLALHALTLLIVDSSWKKLSHQVADLAGTRTLRAKSVEKWTCRD